MNPKDQITDEKIRQGVARLVAKLPAMPATPKRTEMSRFERLLAETITAPESRAPLPTSTPQKITAADFAKAEQEYRAARARGEKMPWEHNEHLT